MKTQPVNQRHENGTVTNLLRANYILDGAVQFAPEQLFFLQATRQRTVSGGNSYHSVRSLPIPTIPIHCILRLSRTLSPRLSLCLRGSYIHVCLCPAEKLGVQSSTSNGGYSKAYCKNSADRGWTTSLPLSMHRQIAFGGVTRKRNFDGQTDREEESGRKTGLKPARIVNSDIHPGYFRGFLHTVVRVSLFHMLRDFSRLP